MTWKVHKIAANHQAKALRDWQDTHLFRGYFAINNIQLEII